MEIKELLLKLLQELIKVIEIPSSAKKQMKMTKKG